MIGIIFEFAGEIVEVRVVGTNVVFRKSSFGSNFVPIGGLKLSEAGAKKEFPELKDDPYWKIKSIDRFREKMKSFPNELAVVKYLIEDLRKFGYVPKFMQKQGFRPEAIK